ncbi:hypothetical protein BH09MYX1_BH09MYX1_30450 [soil metagenome]
MRPAIAFLSLMAVVACRTEGAPPSSVSLPPGTAVTGKANSLPIATTMAPQPIASVKDYFPDESHGGFIPFVREWYGKHLHTMGEPSLFEASTATPTKETWRFVWLRTWGHPVAIRFDVAPSGTTMRYVVLDGQGGYAPGKISADVTRTISAPDWMRVTSALTGAGFWALPTSKDDGGMDGLEWIIEGTQNGRYHVVDRWTPSYETSRRGLADYESACRTAFDVAGVPDKFE